MIIQQALYGYDRGGHGLLAISDHAIRETASELAFKSDLPGTPPPGLEWSAYLRAFPHGGAFYVLLRTMPDPGAPRSGMVFAHALFMRISDLPELGSLRRAIAFLLDRPTPGHPMAPLQLAPSASFQPTEIASGAADVAEALAANAGTPIVWTGQEGWEELVTSLWDRLPPTMRRSFRFRLSFGPQDVEGDPQILVCTPKRMESRWTSHVRISAASTRGFRTDAGRLLLSAEGSERLQEFAASIGAELHEAGTAVRLEHAASLADMAQPTPDTLVQLVRMTGFLSPSPRVGMEAKNSMSSALVECIPVMVGADILTLRQLRLNAFADGGKALWDGVRDWVAAGAPPSGRADLATPRILGQAMADGPVAEWKEAIRDGLTKLAQTPADIAPRLWAWWSQDVSLIHALGPLLPVEDRLQRELVRVAPAVLAEQLAEPVATLCVARGWLLLHAAVVKRAFAFMDAVRIHLSVDNKPQCTEPLDTILAGVLGNEVVECTLVLPDPRLIRRAGEACAREPSLLRGFNAGSEGWRSVLLAALVARPDAWKGLVDYGGLVPTLAKLGSKVDDALWKVVVRTPLADISGRSERADVWSLLPAKFVDAFLQPTADGWLARWCAAPNFEGIPEEPLRGAVTSRRRIATFLSKPCSDNAVLELFELFVDLDESDFVDWFERRANKPLDAVIAAEAGRLAKRRGWSIVPQRIVSRYSTRNDLLPALRESYDLLPLVDRIWLYWSGVSLPAPSHDELWQLLVEVASETFPEPSEAKDVWFEAGGQRSTFPGGETGRARWQAAIRLIRQGGGGVSGHALINAMLAERPRNDKLKRLSQSAPFSDGW